ncbi:hypothetical protein K458DRAFT_420245 [Lentithecium fluviatile CBS 122367]|uniref:Uncharacterized protein n=1 Tax=Lentithecium fluviatile CBS 122367 TaxID=1168545 RepID=A0A6G1IUF9_9PLEO|nr:hypothetical protein K458DRAFT_420245 [Lentithecium fluviatile CBS 122367]
MPMHSSAPQTEPPSSHAQATSFTAPTCHHTCNAILTATFPGTEAPSTRTLLLSCLCRYVPSIPAKQ